MGSTTLGLEVGDLAFSRRIAAFPDIAADTDPYVSVLIAEGGLTLDCRTRSTTRERSRPGRPASPVAPLAGQDHRGTGRRAAASHRAEVAHPRGTRAEGTSPGLAA